MVPISHYRQRLFHSAAIGAVLIAAALCADIALADAETDRLAHAYNVSGVDLFGHIAAAETGNVVVSPYSVGTALAMAYAGAANGTRAEMADKLGFDWSPEEIGAINQRLAALVTERVETEDATIAIANALALTGLGDLVSDDYKARIASQFDAELFSGATLADINAWVSDKTDGKIDEILTKLDPLSVAVLLNAIHFSASWAEPFTPESTSPGAFRLSASDTIQVPMMHKTLSARILKADGFDAIALPYQGDQLEMILFVPAGWGEAGAVPISLTGESLGATLAALRGTTPQQLALSMPKFAFDFGTGLIPALKARGVDLPFDPDAADFSGIIGNAALTDPIYISQAEHKAMIDVNEAGTEAAAATAIEFAVRAMAPKPLPFYEIDRPFLFAIADKASGAVLFMGRVSDPRDGLVEAKEETIDVSVIPDQMQNESGLAETLVAAMDMLVQPKLAMSAPSPMMMSGGGYAPGEGDVFTTFEDGRVLSVADAPVSTFSVDVDTAAYSYVRRMLQEGALPQADAVRVEEMINYFDYGYAGPDSVDTPFAVHTSLFPTPWRDGTQDFCRSGHSGLSRAGRRPAAGQYRVSRRYLGFDGRPRQAAAFEKVLRDPARPARRERHGRYRRLCRFGRYRARADQGQRQGQDPHRAQRVEARRIDGWRRRRIELAYQLAAEAETATGTNRVILATDGDFNVGIDDPGRARTLHRQKARCRHFAQRARLRFGAISMTRRCRRWPRTATAPPPISTASPKPARCCPRRSAASLITLARDVKVQVEFNPAYVAEYRLIGYETRALNSEDFNNDAVDAGDIGSGHSVTALYEITPVGSPAQLNDALRYGETGPEEADTSGEAAYVKLRYKPGDADESELMTLPVNASAALADVTDAPEAARLAAAVAAFGQKLRDNPMMGRLELDRDQGPGQYGPRQRREWLSRRIRPPGRPRRDNRREPGSTVSSAEITFSSLPLMGRETGVVEPGRLQLRARCSCQRIALS